MAPPPRHLRTTALLLAGGLVTLLATAAASIVTGVPIERFTRDPAAIAGMNPASGLLSSIGVLGWCAAVAVCAFSAGLLRRRADGREEALFLFGAAALTSVLLVDDLFMVHDFWAPRVLGLDEKLLTGLYGAGLLALLVRFRTTVATTGTTPLIAAMLLFAASLGVDLVPDTVLPMHHLWEDGAKLLGILAWLAYFLSTSAAALERRDEAAEHGPG